MLLQDVFVPDNSEVLPPGLFGAMYNAFPHLFLSRFPDPTGKVGLGGITRRRDRFPRAPAEGLRGVKLIGF